MSNAVSASPISDVRNALDRLKPQLAMALPKHLTPERLVRVTMTAIQNNPKLLECDRNSFYAAVMTCAALGLEPDGVLGQAYLVPFKGRVQFIPGYKGLITLARNSGDVVSISAHEVREKDHFDFAFGLNERCDHRPARGERGEIIYFYAVARFKDGGHHFDVMTKEEVDKVRAGSPGKDHAPWREHYVEMGRKTVIRRIAKYLPMSVQKAAAMADAYERGSHAVLDDIGVLQVTGGDAEAGQQPQQQIESAAQAPAKTDAPKEPEKVNPETGEVTPSALDQFEAA